MGQRGTQEEMEEREMTGGCEGGSKQGHKDGAHLSNRSGPKLNIFRPLINQANMAERLTKSGKVFTWRLYKLCQTLSMFVRFKNSGRGELTFKYVAICTIINSFISLSKPGS